MSRCPWGGAQSGPWERAQLAKRAKVTQGYISQLEAGTIQDIGTKVAVRLAKALGVPVTDLLA